MRLWSLDPKYLDSKGLNGVWREGLLAQAVLSGRTEGWKHHSHLLRFKKHEKPMHAIGFYLLKIFEEASNRGYSYDKLKIVEPVEKVNPIKVTKDQLIYEFYILKERLRIRAHKRYEKVLKLERSENHPKPHPLFVVLEGEVEPWEKSYWTEKRKPNLILH